MLRQQGHSHLTGIINKVEMVAKTAAKSIQNSLADAPDRLLHSKHKNYQTVGRASDYEEDDMQQRMLDAEDGVEGGHGYGES